MNHMTAHIVNQPDRWKTGTGGRRSLRSSTNRHRIYEMTAGLVWRKAWNPGPTMVEIKLHSVMTRHARNPVDTYASTQLTLTRQDATTLAAVLLAAVNDMDAERGKPTT